MQRESTHYERVERDYRSAASSNRDLQVRVERLRDLVASNREIFTWSALTSLRQENDFLLGRLTDDDLDDKATANGGKTRSRYLTVVRVPPPPLYLSLPPESPKARIIFPHRPLPA